MRNFIIKRIMISIVILFFVAFIVYAIIRCMPTSYIENLAMQKAQLPGGKSYAEWLEQLTVIYGLDKGIAEGFFSWLGNALRGDFGDSWQFNVPVVEKFSEVIWDSFALASISFVLELVIAIPLGILSARKQYSKTDYAVTVFALIGISLPTFFFATILKYIFSVQLGWFDLYGKVGRYYDQLDAFGQFMDVAAHYVLPIVTIVIVSVGSLMRYTRTNMLEVLNSCLLYTSDAADEL